ncbi:hypothetical protein H8356DRAFT_933847 [Neocallimastix lanati (nom. inval.)]|nr:hypothetical protein H8356DRAFT_933847 [Neocallimastix sp. JGI-2020a]
MDKMGKQFSQIINKNNLRNKINKITNKDNLYAIEKNIENLSENIENKKKLYKAERSKLSIYRHPLLISKYFCLYLIEALQKIGRFILSHLIALTFLILLIISGVYFIETNVESDKLHVIRSTLIWYGYWIMLGVLSSIGLGTGLHTFVLFLGPHIAEVTAAAYTCGNLNFKVFGEGSFICSGKPLSTPISVLSIYSKIKMPSFLWGLGTALGELPPYFVSRAASLTGQKDQTISRFENINENSSFADKVQAFIFKFLRKMGFFGILLCASIPNPLFDIAGILCGHFLIPFGTFFGATFIGKALIKNTIQSVFIIIVFSETVINYILSLISGYPTLYNFVKNAIEGQTKKFKANSTGSVEDNGSGIISIIWNTLIITMISYFVFSIIESLAISEFQKLKEKELSIIVDESKKKLNIKGPDMQVITEVADVAFNYINSKLNNFDKTESMEDLKSEIDMTNNRPKEQNNITDKRSKPRKSKLYKNKY